MERKTEYNACVNAIRSFPDANRFSVLSAASLFSLALTRLIDPAPYAIRVRWMGAGVVFSFHLYGALILLSATLTATGVDWLLRGHPSFRQGARVFEHWVLPFTTVLILGISLFYFPAGNLWWAAFGVGGALLMLVFWAEYVTLDPSDAAYPLAMAGLTALSFAFFLILLVALRYAETALLWESSATFFAAFFVTLRTLHLRLSGRWEVAWSLGIALIVAELAAAFHFFPLSPLRAGIFLLAPLYALTHLAALLGEGVPERQAALEPLFLLGVICLFALL